LWSNLGALARQSMGDIKEADVREALERENAESPTHGEETP